MLNKLKVLEDKYKELSQKVADPDIISDQPTWQKLMKETSEIEPIVMKYREYSKASQSIAESKQILEEESDEDLRELAKMELSESEALLEEYENELKILLVPKDPNDEKNVFMEVRAGTGGDEAGLFAEDLLRMYRMFADKQKWKTEIIIPNKIPFLNSKIANNIISKTIK